MFIGVEHFAAGNIHYTKNKTLIMVRIIRNCLDIKVKINESEIHFNL